MKSLSFWADFRQPANEVAILNSDTRRLVDSALPVEPRGSMRRWQDAVLGLLLIRANEFAHGE